MVVGKVPIHAGIYQMSVWLGDWHCDYDEKRNFLSFAFKTGHPEVNTPNPEAIGFMDVPVNWSVNGSVRPEYRAVNRPREDPPPVNGSLEEPQVIRQETADAVMNRAAETLAPAPNGLSIRRLFS